MEALTQDIRYAFRALRKTPLFTIVAVLTLALGIGANTTIYTWLEGVVLRPLPIVKEYDRLVLVITRGPQNVRWSFSIPDWQDVAADAKLLEGVAISTGAPVSVRTEGQAERAWGEVASANYFDILGVHPFLGRGFLPSGDSAVGAHNEVVLAYGYWRRKFAADSGIIGKTISINNHPLTVVGVMPPRFGGKTAGLQFDLWVPLSMVGVATGSPQMYASRTWQTYDAFGRLKPGVTFDEANAEMKAIGKRLAAAYPNQDGNLGRDLLPTSEDYVQAAFKPAVFAMLGVTVVVLLIACANIANLLLARAAARRREMGIRLALGARRSALVRQLMVESLIVAVVGGGLGILVASWSGGTLTALLPPVTYPVNIDVHLDGRVLAFAFLVTVVTVLLFGMVPALQASRPDLVPSLKDGAAAASHSRGLLRGTLVVAQIALSVVALVAAGLFTRSLRAGERMDTGYRSPDHVLLVTTDLLMAGYDRPHGRQIHDELLRRVEAIPEVASATTTDIVPLGFGGNNSQGAEIEGYVPQKDENMSIHDITVGPRYFETIGTPIIEGRDFTVRDDSAAQKVVIVNEAFAKKYWPGIDPIGRWINFSGTGQRVVIGVAATSKYKQLNETPVAMTFKPFLQDYHGDVTLEVRTTGDPMRVAKPLRNVFAQLDPNLPFLDVRTFSEHMGAAVYFMRLGAIMLGIFGALALVLSTMGIYSVVAYSVSQRTRELGIRTALGAATRDILALVLGEGLRLTAIGIITGSILAFGVGKLLASQLVGVGAGDPLTFFGIGALLAAVALFATLAPARRAARIDPMVALRTE
jgi:predicted permease